MASIVVEGVVRRDHSDKASMFLIPLKFSTMKVGVISVTNVVFVLKWRERERAQGRVIVECKHEGM